MLINIYRLIDMDEASGLLRLLGDETRLRLLRVLSREALNVSELTAILGVAQSGVSRHLGLLREAGLVVEQRGGTFTWYRLAPEFEKDSSERAPLWAWLRAEFARATTDTRADDARLEEIRRVRQESFAQHGANRSGVRNVLVLVGWGERIPRGGPQDIGERPVEVEANGSGSR